MKRSGNQNKIKRGQNNEEKWKPIGERKVKNKKKEKGKQK